MNTTSETMQHQPARATGLKWVAGGSMVEAIGAFATIALAIVGLAGVLSATLAAIATIVIGASILIEGGAFTAGAATFNRSEGSTLETSGGASASFLGGVAGIILGILALLGVAWATLVSVAVLVYGASFMLSSISAERFSSTVGTQGAGAELSTAGTSGHFIVGVAAVVLGILAVVGLSQLTLVLVGLLCLGAGALFSGSALGVRSASAATHV